jgi:hypothetical protein
MRTNENWIQTYTGRQFWPLDPSPDEIFIEDIAHALSMQCRFTGHCLRFYSVAEHSVFVSRLVPSEHALWGLLHDASEAYLCDLARPVKRCVVGYSGAEERLMRVVCVRFDLSHEQPSAVTVADMRMCVTEAAQNMAPFTADWSELPEPYPVEKVKLYNHMPHVAEARFLQRFEELRP